MQEPTVKVVASVGPPVGITGMHFLGVSLPDWLLILTIIYTAANLFALVRDKYIRHYFGKKKEATDEQEGSE